MRHLLLGAFVLFYRLTGAKIPAYLLAIIYISALNLITINGIAYLLSDYVASQIITVINLMLHTPFILLSILIMISINYFLFPPFKSLEKNAKNHDGYLNVLLYSILALIIISYNQIFALTN